MVSASTRRTQYGLGWLLLMLSVGLLPPGDLMHAADGDSPVAEAARAGDFAAVRELIDESADVNTPAPDGSTALLWAAYNADLEIAQALIAAGAKLDAANTYGVTPLLQASRTADVAVMEVLLEAGANPALTHPEGETPLMAASRTGRIDAVRLLLAHDARVNSVDSFQQQTALMWAAEEGHIDVVDALLDAGALPNFRARVTSLTEREHADHPTGGFTAVMWAVRNGDEDVVRRLVQGGADLNLTNGDGATAMTIAIVNDRFDLAATLLELGADANDGSLYHAVLMRDATTDWYARDGSRLRADHPNELTALDLVELLLDRGADPNKAVVGRLHSTSMCCDDFANASPFYRAAIAADVEALQLMIERGADIEWTPSEVSESAGGGRGANANVGRAPIMVAMRGGRGVRLSAGPGYTREGPPPFREPSNREPLDALRMLLEAGANVDALTPDGAAALHQAVDRRKPILIRALAEAGATLDLPDGDGKTPLDLAMCLEPEERDPFSLAPEDEDVVAPEDVVALMRELVGLPPAAAEGEATPICEDPDDDDGDDNADVADDDDDEDAEEVP